MRGLLSRAQRRDLVQSSPSDAASVGCACAVLSCDAGGDPACENAVAAASRACAQRCTTGGVARGRALKLMARVQAHFSAVTALSLSPDGWTLLSAGRDKVAVLWDLRKYAQLATVPIHEAVEGAHPLLAQTVRGLRTVWALLPRQEQGVRPRNAVPDRGPGARGDPEEDPEGDPLLR